MCVCVLVFQSCPTLCDPMDCSQPTPSVHEILPARMLEWVVIPFSRESSPPRDQTCFPCFSGRFFTIWTIREVRIVHRYKEQVNSSLKKGDMELAEPSDRDWVVYTSDYKIINPAKVNITYSLTLSSPNSLSPFLWDPLICSMYL